jgi:hypothetical protein
MTRHKGIRTGHRLADRQGRASRRYPEARIIRVILAPSAGRQITPKRAGAREAPRVFTPRA